MNFTFFNSKQMINFFNKVSNFQDYRAITPLSHLIHNLLRSNPNMTSLFEGMVIFEEISKAVLRVDNSVSLASMASKGQKNIQITVPS